MERHAAASCRRRGVGAAIEQVEGHVVLPLVAREVEGRHAVVVGVAHVGAGLNEQLHGVEPALLGRHVECRAVVCVTDVNGRAGVEEAAVIVREIRAKKGAIGYDAAKGEITDLVKAGIIDPAKVTRNALLNASSIAGLLLTTEALVCEIPEKKEKMGGPGGGMGGGDMDMY